MIEAVGNSNDKRTSEDEMVRETEIQVVPQNIDVDVVPE